MKIRLRLSLHLLFALFAVFPTSPSSLAIPMAAHLTKSVLPAVFSLVTTTTTEESLSRNGDEIGFSGECLGLARAFHARPIGTLKLNCGIFAEIAEFLAAESVASAGNVRTVINGLEYSGHALDQMAARGFVPPSGYLNLWNTTTAGLWR
jgi:hypothetical protein